MSLTHRQQSARDRAVQHLLHYVRLVDEQLGLDLNGECYSEISSIVDSILDAAAPDSTSPAPVASAHPQRHPGVTLLLFGAEVDPPRSSHIVVRQGGGEVHYWPCETDTALLKRRIMELEASLVGHGVKLPEEED